MRKLTIWFTSDTHYLHGNIIRLSNRPFSSLEEMHEVMIERWNERVQRSDSVYHLGDFAFARYTHEVESILDRLNGQIFLVQGNHDHRVVRKARGFAWVKSDYMLKVGKTYIHMYHYPIMDWNRKYHGSWHLHGHSHCGQSHSRFSGTGAGNILDVGVDCHDYRPISFEEIAQMMGS